MRIMNPHRIEDLFSRGTACEVFLDYDPVFPDDPEAQPKGAPSADTDESRRESALVEKKT